MFIISIIEAIGSITSIYIIRFGLGAYTSTASGSDTDLDSDSSNIVAGEV